MHRYGETAALCALCALVLSVGVACGDQTLEEVDPSAAPERPTYTEHVAPLMETYCTACHAPDAQPGEAEGYGFETCEKVKRHWDDLVESTFEEQSMPPGGALRVTSSHRLTLERWWAQGATCQ